jgi:ribosomal protein S18 acetylase RimI-like enzyme
VDAFVEEATEATPELVEALARLVPQLSRSSPPPTAEQLAAVVASPATVLFVARLGGEGEEQGAGGQVVGSLTLVLFRIPTGMRAWIEDVVVDEAARGAGVGEALTLAALERAADAGARTVDLTSRPSREAANRLYSRLGFELRETNVYRWTHPT